MSAESHFQMTKVIRLCSSWPFYIKKEISFVTFSKLPHFCLFTELEAGWGDLWKSRCPSPLLLPSHCWPKGCPDLQGRTLPPWAACCSSQSASQEKYVLVLRWKLTSSSLCSLPLVLSLGISDKSLAPASLLPHFRWWYMMVRTSPSFLLAKHSLLPHALLKERCSCPPVPLWPLVGLSHWALWCPELGTAPVWVKGRITSVTVLVLCHRPGLWHTAGSCSGPQGLLCKGVFPAGWLQDVSEYGTVPPQPISPACRAPWGWQQDPQVCRPLPVLCHLQPCWGHALPVTINQGLGQCQGPCWGLSSAPGSHFIAERCSRLTSSGWIHADY